MVNMYRSATAEPKEETIILVFDVREGFTGKLMLDLGLEG